LASSEK
jgi:hypothetical protein